MTAPDGGFASSYDADSEGEEGKFYVWELAEIAELLGAEDAAFFAGIYDVNEAGNWENTNILNRLRSLHLLSPAEEEKLAGLRAKLLAARRSRVPPGWDDKVLADWNGLAIAALVNAGRTFGEPAWFDAAQRTYVFIKERMSANGRLLHSYRAGQAKTPAVASDYANMIAAALSLYLATGDVSTLSDAESWTEIMAAQYWAEGHGGYYLSAADTGDIIIRTLSARDDAVPNANAVMLGNLNALHLLTGEARYRDTAEALRKGVAAEAMRTATLHTGYFGALADHLRPQHLVLLRGAGETALRDALSHISLPGVVTQWIAEDATAPANSPAFGKRAIEGKATAYICIGPQCSPPVSSPEDLLAAFRNSRGGVVA
jgi:uncharacterized protein YyaL (SSP411 family)